MTKRENPRRREREFNKFQEKSSKISFWFVTIFAPCFMSSFVPN